MRLFLFFLLLSGCTDYNAKIKVMGETGPILTCKRVVATDEGGVCHDGYGCSDGKDHIGQCYDEVK